MVDLGKATLDRYRAKYDGIASSDPQLNQMLLDIINLLVYAEGLERRWVSVKERLPERYRNVLICSLGGEQFVAELRYNDEERMEYWDGAADLYLTTGVITHWAELPPPPVEKY
jgi:hypothetical protein